ncbi:MAG: LysE family transporter [Nitrososphaera sp.]|uniref:LysE family transporter n=1 Tax=Nitrososphaera sp. TaxID=1971748 RepID=UPI003D6E4F0B
MAVELAEFAAEVVAVSASGVLAPGPLFVANMLYGAKQGAMSGVRVAHGHALIEIALIAAIAAGLFSASAFVSENARAVTLVGGVAILGFAGIQVFAVARKKEQSFIAGKKGPLAVGAALTALNPFFLAWWLTVGLKLVSDSAAFGGVAGVALLFALHVWMDYAWLAATAYLASRGSSVLQSKYYRLLMYGLAAALAYYGVQFLVSALEN